MTIWRDPAEETEDYPNLVVHDGRVTGSITTGRSRLPLWAIIYTAIHQGWDEVEAGWSPTEHYGYTAQDLADFLYYLLEARAEFGRLLLVLANAERLERERQDDALHQAVEDGHPGVDAKDGAIMADITPGKEGAFELPDPWWQDEELKAPVIAQLRRCLAALED